MRSGTGKWKSETKIYVVMGVTGEYDSRQDWSVAAYFDEEMANKHVELAEQEARRIAEKFQEKVFLLLEPEDLPPDERNPYDPWMSIEKRTDYYVLDVGILDEVPLLRTP